MNGGRNEERMKLKCSEREKRKIKNKQKEEGKK
jgi:hypothetical protein